MSPKVVSPPLHQLIQTQSCLPSTEPNVNSFAELLVRQGLPEANGFISCAKTG